MPSIKTANANVSNTILKALGNGSTKPTISANEFSTIKRTALNEVKNSGNPTRTLNSVKASFELANRVTGGKYKEKFTELVETATTVADRRKQNLRQVDSNDWTFSNDTNDSPSTSSPS